MKKIKKQKRRPSFKRLNKKRDKLIIELTVLLKGTLIRGSIRVQGNRCGGSKNCKCKRKINPILHGPYPYLSFRGIKSNHSILLGKTKKEHAEKAVSNHKKITETIIELSEIDFNILRYHSDKLNQEKVQDGKEKV